VTLLGVAAMEAVLRLFFPLPSGGGEFIRVIRQEHPGVQPVVVYRRNAFGLRTRTLESVAKPADTIRVMAFGASTTDQTTQNIEDSWVGILEEELGAAFAGCRGRSRGANRRADRRRPSGSHRRVAASPAARWTRRARRGFDAGRC
jgi:hypothetical protein